MFARIAAAASACDAAAATGASAAAGSSGVWLVTAGGVSSDLDADADGDPQNLPPQNLPLYPIHQYGVQKSELKIDF